ncbi:MAG: hypothetical protein DHS80DRAFT_15684 [Piptocephalis tieghemiana]|nr:MAG: hypothetical protein DHS80DRAFT_15684 [Piptocephalis tieghemiana]
MSTTPQPQVEGSLDQGASVTPTPVSAVDLPSAPPGGPSNPSGWIQYLESTLRTPNVPVEVVQGVFERFLQQFPSSAKHWTQYAEWARGQGKQEMVQGIYKRCLRNLPDVNLWNSYIGFIQSLPVADAKAKREAVQAAYDGALAAVGWQKGAGIIWMGCIEHAKSLQTDTTWEESRKMDSLRALYRRAIAVPTAQVETIWREYDAFETGLSKLTAKKFLSEQSPIYMTARTTAREMRGYVDGLDRTSLATPPTWTEKEKEQLHVWKRYIAWEKSNPLKSPSALDVHARVTGAYKEALMYLRHYPEIWYDAANYQLTEAQRPEDAVIILRTAIDAKPSSFLLHFALAEVEERRKRYTEAKTVYEDLLSGLNDRVKQAEQEYTEAMKRLEEEEEEEANTQGKSTEEGGGPMEMGQDGEGRERLREAARARDRARERVKEERKGKLARIGRLFSSAWIAYMRFSRRTEGIKTARGIFSRARKTGLCSHHLFIAAALMEFYNTKEPGVAGRIFELGLKTFSEDAQYISTYLGYLIQVNDDSNIRALFERTINTLPKPDAMGIWRQFLHYESQYGDLVGIEAADRRFSEVYPEGKGVWKERMGGREGFLIPSSSSPMRFSPPPSPSPFSLSLSLSLSLPFTHHISGISYGRGSICQSSYLYWTGGYTF